MRDNGLCESLPFDVGFSGESGRSVVDSVRNVSRRLIDLDTESGAHALADVAVRAAVAARCLLGDGRVGRELVAAVAEIHEVAGWIAFDADRQGDAERMNREALVLSRLAGDVDIENLTKLNMSMRSAQVGRYGEAVAVAQSVMDSTASSRVRAMCLVRQARAYSKARDARAIRLLRDAWSVHQDGTSSRDPSWAWWIEECELRGHYASALLDLGRPEEAAGVLWDVVHGLDDSPQPMYRVLLRTRLLQALVTTERWSEVENVLEHVDSRLGHVGSTRAVRALVSVTGTIARSRTPSTVRDLAVGIHERWACSRDLVVAGVEHLVGADDHRPAVLHGQFYRRA